MIGEDETNAVECTRARHVACHIRSHRLYVPVFPCPMADVDASPPVMVDSMVSMSSAPLHF